MLLFSFDDLPAVTLKGKTRPPVRQQP